MLVLYTAAILLLSYLLSVAAVNTMILAVSSVRRCGVAVRVVLIKPVPYSAVRMRTPSAPMATWAM